MTGLPSTGLTTNTPETVRTAKSVAFMKVMVKVIGLARSSERESTYAGEELP